MKVLEWVLGNPWVFENVRPLAVGGIDMSPAYRLLRCDGASSVLDIGCGTGDALRHLDGFSSYLGVDTDARAIRFAEDRWHGRANVRFECRTSSVEDLRVRAPTHVAMVGLLHHLDDQSALGLLGTLVESSRLVRAVSLDIVHVPGLLYNNLIASLDRGRFCRNAAGYVSLVERAGLKVTEQMLIRSHPKRGLVRYFVLGIERR
jgi:SAM-dependent methyltransferase